MKKFINAMKEKKEQKKSGIEPNQKKVKPVKAKKQKSTRDIAFSKQKTAKWASWFVIALMLISIFFNISHFTKVQTIRNFVAASQDEVSDQLSSLQAGNLLESYSLVVYVEDFLKDYYNIPQDNEARDTRIDRLSGYFVNGFTVNTNTFEQLNEFTGSRSINWLDFVEVNRISETEASVNFRVGYEIVEVVEKEEIQTRTEENDDGDEEEIEETVTVEEEINTTNTVEISVPVVTDGEGFAVTKKPSITSRDLQSQIDYEEPKLEGSDLSGAERETLNTFLNDFFTSYGMTDDRLPLMANTDRGLSNQIMETVTVTDSALGSDEQYIVLAEVLYRDQETNVSNVYSYQVEVVTDSNGLYVQQIN